MKGIILAGGTGSRLAPLTDATNKHLLPVANLPMVYYPIKTLTQTGIKDILIITGPDHAGHFLKLLGSGSKFNATFTYKIQDEAGGIAHALALAEQFAAGDSVTVILGDNIFQDDFSQAVQSFQSGAKVFLKEVSDAQRFGVAEMQEEKVISIEEKPKQPKSNLAVTGLYIYDNEVFTIIKTLKPSGRGELEITDVNNAYLKKGSLEGTKVNGYWSDAGTFDSLMRASNLVKEAEQGK